MREGTRSHESSAAGIAIGTILVGALLIPAGCLVFRPSTFVGVGISGQDSQGANLVHGLLNTLVIPFMLMALGGILWALTEVAYPDRGNFRGAESPLDVDRLPEFPG